jgi:lysophospholipase L1-like esterase
VILAVVSGFFLGASAGRAAETVNLVFDGDSISAGWGAAPGHGLDAHVVSAFGDAAQVHNVAVGGRPVSECLTLYPQLLPPLFAASARANVIVFHAGDNDIAQGRNASQTYAAFTAYVAAAHAQKWKVVVSTEMRRPDFHLAQAAQLNAYNLLLQRNTAHADAVVNFDADARIADLSHRKDLALFSPDGIHPSDGGYAILAAMLVPAVKQVAR